MVIAQLLAHAADESILCERGGDVALARLLWGGFVFNGCFLKTKKREYLFIFADIIDVAVCRDM